MQGGPYGDITNDDTHLNGEQLRGVNIKGRRSKALRSSKLTISPWFWYTLSTPRLQSKISRFKLQSLSSPVSCKTLGHHIICTLPLFAYLLSWYRDWHQLLYTSFHKQSILKHFLGHWQLMRSPNVLF